MDEFLKDLYATLLQAYADAPMLDYDDTKPLIPVSEKIKRRISKGLEELRGNSGSGAPHKIDV